MRYLRKYDFFKEVLNISTTDRPDEKLAKQSANEIEFHLNKYPKGKQSIEQLYNSTKNDLEIEKELKKIVEYEIPPEKGLKINPFLSEWAKICSLESRILKANNQKIKAESDIQSVTDEKLKKDLTDKVTVYKKDLSTLPNELKKLMTDHETKMKEVRKNLEEDIKEIKFKK
jgi:hypothetical protein